MSKRILVATFAVAALATVWILLGRRDQRPVSSAQPARAANLLLITIDTLRADAVGAYGSTTSRTPALDSLARQGVLFERAYATAPITLPSHATMMTGLYPPGHAARHNGIAMRTGPRTIAEAFKASGARTGAFVTAFPLDRSFGLARGFDIYSDRMPRGPDGRVANDRAGRLAVDEAIAWLRESADGRFFAWVHLFEPHAPYGNPQDGRPAIQRYADDVAEADRQVQRLIDAVAQQRSDTGIVVASDHGEAFGEHGEIAHSIFVYDTTLHVPLIIVAPGVAPRREPVPVSLADLAPTVAALAGLQRWDTDGSDLRVGDDGAPSRARTHSLYAESFAPLVDFGWSSLRSLRSGQWKYIAAPKPELYDVDADAAEAHNLVEQEAVVAADLAARVRTISGAELPGAPAAALDLDARRRLQALGYAAGSRSATPGRRRDPKDAKALAAAIAAMLSGDLHGEALEKAVREVLAEDPDNPQASLRLGYLRLQAGRCAEAEKLFARALTNGLAGADAHLGLATCQGRRGATSEALRSLEQARGREPQNAVVIANIGIALAAMNDYQGAAATLREALAIDPDLHEARFNLALAYARAGERSRATDEAQALLKRLPPNAPQRSEVERLIRALR